MGGDAGAQLLLLLLLRHEVRPWKRGLGSFEASRSTGSCRGGHQPAEPRGARACDRE